MTDGPIRRTSPAVSRRRREETTSRAPLLNPAVMPRPLFVASAVLFVLALLTALSLSIANAEEVPGVPASSPTAGDAGREPGSFTLADVAAGRVPRAEYDAFWSRQRDQILAAPCLDTAGTIVTVFVGADERWGAELSEAVREHGEACLQQREQPADEIPDAPAS